MVTATVKVAPATPSSILEDIKKCSSMFHLKQYHSQLVRLGCSPDNYVAAALIHCSGERGDFAYALKVFDTMPSPDTFLYNLILRSNLLHLPSSSTTASLSLYCHMLYQSLPPNSFTFPPLIRACSTLDAGASPGKQIHGHVVKLGLAGNGACANNLIHMYLQLGGLEEAKRVYEQKTEKDVVSFTTLVSGYARRGMAEEAAALFRSIPPGLKCSASYNSVLAAMVHGGFYQEAFVVFSELLAEKGLPFVDKFAAATMLSACSEMGALKGGEWILTLIAKNGVEVDCKLATAIIHMYCECGRLEKAREVFDELPRKSLSMWNCIIGGMAKVDGEGAVEMFQKMEREKSIAPDRITFSSLLSACARSGMVDEGRRIFGSMTRAYGIEPTVDVVGCMVDMLGRAGFVEEANKLIDGSAVSDVSLLGALAGACRNTESDELYAEDDR